MSEFHAGFVGIIGQPNAGKSTLLNHLVKEKISIVTAKPQTTRRRVLGVVNRPTGQIIFVDAPGIVRASSGLNHFLQQEAQDVISSSDALIAVVSLTEKSSEDVTQILDMCASCKKPFIVVVTKVDVVEKKHRLEKIKEMVSKISGDVPVIEFSSEWGKDAQSVLTHIEDLMLAKLPPSKAPLYDGDIFTPHTMRDLTAEIIREKCFETLDKEIPYGIAVKISKYDESEKMPKIYADIIVPRESHRGIVVGKGAVMIKKIGSLARKEIEKLQGSQVFLKLDVVVRENWSENKKFMKDLGYVVENE